MVGTRSAKRLCHILVFARCARKSAESFLANWSSMAADDSSTQNNEPQPLQFDRLETSHAGTEDVSATRVTCTMCHKAVADEYYVVNDKSVCASCRGALISAAAAPGTAGPLIIAAIFGVGAALAGAAVYYAVAALMNVEIAIVAILVGYMVGHGVRKGSGGRGGRRFQILAVVLTYGSIDLAYALLALKQLSGVSPLILLGLPIVSIARSLPFGLISALIIVIGLRQAWTMTAPHVFEISGPYKVGTSPAPRSA